MDDSDILADDLRAWFGKGKKGGVGGGGWDRYNTKGERIGKCAAPERGAREGKPKCLSKEKAAQLRAKGGKQAIANAVKRKKAQDPVTDRPGTGNVPKFVSNRIKEQEEQAPVFTFEFEEVLSEKNVPTNPSLWSRAKSEAKKRFDVYPCVPLDSLAITKSGPTSHEDIEIGDEILTYNMAMDNLEWKPVLHKHYYENAPLIEIGKPTGFSVKCTPNHKWVISTKTERKLIEAKDIKTHMDILMCASLQNESSLFLSEWSKNDKWIDYIFSMDVNQREIFLASSIVYDGWDKGISSKFNKRHTFGFTQKKYDHLWASLLAAYLNGYYVSYREKSNQITGATYIRNKRTHATQNLYKKDAGKAPVWCPSTDNETWVMIQNGLITITGNSAYANGWAAKWYKERGGRWRTKKTESNTPHDREWGTDSLVNIYKQDTPGQMDEFFGIHFKEVGSDLVKDFKRDTPGQTNEAKQKWQSVSSASRINISEILAVIFESLALTAPVELVESEEHAVPVRAMTETVRHQLLQEAYEDWGELNEAAEYQGRKVQLRKPFRTPGGPKKFSVYVKNDKGNVVKVNFGDPKLSIKRDDPARRRNFRARHGCDNPGPVWKAKYWSCKFWSRKSVTALVKG